jgi:hypothetical protein
MIYAAILLQQIKQLPAPVFYLVATCGTHYAAKVAFVIVVLLVWFSLKSF